MDQRRTPRALGRLIAVGALAGAIVVGVAWLSSAVRVLPFDGAGTGATAQAEGISAVPPHAAAARRSRGSQRAPATRHGPSLTTRDTCRGWLQVPAVVRRRFTRAMGWHGALAHVGARAYTQRCRRLPRGTRARTRPATHRFARRAARSALAAGTLSALASCRLPRPVRPQQACARARRRARDEARRHRLRARRAARLRPRARQQHRTATHRHRKQQPMPPSPRERPGHARPRPGPPAPPPPEPDGATVVIDAPAPDTRAPQHDATAPAAPPARGDDPEPAAAPKPAATTASPAADPATDPSAPAAADEPSTTTPPATNQPSTTTPPATDQPSTTTPPATDQPSTTTPPATDQPAG